MSLDLIDRLPKKSATPYDRMPAFREAFRDLSEDDYRALEDRLEAYLLLTIRFVFEDAGAGRLDLTIPGAPPTMGGGSVDPTHKSIQSLP
jgi:hypothetical protein